MFTHRPFLTFALTLTAVFLLIACGNTSDPTVTPTSTLESTSVESTAIPEPATAAPTTESTALPEPTTAAPTKEKAEPSAVDAPLDGPDRLFGEVEEVEVSATFEVGGETKEVIIASGTDGEVLKEGDVVKTDSTEEVATDITVDGTTRMVRTSPDTEWTVGDAEETGAVVIELTVGEIKIVDDGFGYFPMQVNTPTGSVLLRGTWVLVRVLSDGSTEVKCVRGPCQYLDENSMSVVLEDGATVHDTTDADPSTGTMTAAEITEFESIPEIQTSNLQDIYNERDPEDYKQLLGMLSVGMAQSAGQWSPPYATYSGEVTIDGEDAPDGTEIRFRIPTSSEMDNSALFSDDAFDNDPSWSSDGTQITFASYRDRNYEIYVMDADGSNPTNITNNAGWDDYPSWSPDGAKIAFSTVRDGNYEIYVMNADGSNPTNISNNDASDYALSWSPDGTKIAFTSKRGGNREIYVMDADGSNQTRITNNDAWDDEPSWSHDGTKIAFSSDRDGNGEIYVMDADGSNPTRITNHAAWDFQPSWSPDGTKIAFTSYRDGNYGIYVMDADGSNPTNITNNDAYDAEPSWSPDGTKIAFTSERDGFNDDIYVMDADGSNQSSISYPPLYLMTDPADSATFATGTTSEGGKFSKTVFFSVSDSPLKLLDGDFLAVDVVTSSGTSASGLIKWSKGLTANSIRLNVRTERPSPPNKAPTVVITSPSTGHLFETTDNISFTGSASDDEDGSLTGAFLAWTSDIDGQLGTGGSINATLSAGSHKITLTATDSQQSQGSSEISVMIELGPVALPAIVPNVIPHVFVGSVTVSGEVAADGTEVSAWVSDYTSAVGEGTVSGGSYVMNVSQYGAASFAGKTLTFKISDADTGQTYTWEKGGATVLDLVGD